MKDKICKDVNYMEGHWAGKKMAETIEKTVYDTLEQAIRIKQVLINNFEKDFGYTRNDAEFDRNYSYNYGLLDSLIKIHQENGGREGIL